MLNAILQMQTIEQVWLHLIKLIATTCIYTQYYYNRHWIRNLENAQKFFVFHFILSPFTSIFLLCMELTQM